VIYYNVDINQHTIMYSGDQEKYVFDVTADINNGDLWVIC